MLEAIRNKLSRLAGKTNLLGASSPAEDVNGAEMPYGTKVSKMTRDGIELYWKKPERAEGYEIFRSYDPEEPFECIKAFDVRRVGVYTDSDFDRSKKKIYYCMRSFITDEDGAKVYSDKTEPVIAAYREEIEPEREVTYMYSDSKRRIMAFHGWGEATNVSWSSSDPEIANVDDEGIITAISKGRCTLTCRDDESGNTCYSEVVVDREPTEPLTPESLRFHYNETEGTWINEGAEKTGKAEIMMVGDLMCGSGQMRKQFTDEDGWVFNSSFEYVKPVTKKADFAIANLETLLASAWPYMIDEVYIDNKNNCNAPSRYLDAVRYAGFDAVTLANNHNCDGGVRALVDTIGEVERYEFPYTGIFRSADDKRYLLVDINGIRVGFLAYMSRKTSFNGKDADWTKTEKSTHLHVYDPGIAVKDVEACRAAGAEYVIAYMHWGIKNFHNITEDQIALAQGIADAGADFIVGSNPHIVQIYDEIEASDGRKVPCYYSVGNFQAKMNQIPGNRDSLMVRIVLMRGENGKIELAENTYIPFHCYNNIDGNLWAPAPLSKKYNTSPKKSNTIHDRIVSSVGSKAREV